VASLVTAVRSGREKLHYLNAAPISDIAERCINRYDQQRVDALTDLKKARPPTASAMRTAPSSPPRPARRSRSTSSRSATTSA
jgi:hypothetical protein